MNVDEFAGALEKLAKHKPRVEDIVSLTDSFLYQQPSRTNTALRLLDRYRNDDALSPAEYTMVRRHILRHHREKMPIQDDETVAASAETRTSTTRLKPDLSRSGDDTATVVTSSSKADETVAYNTVPARNEITREAVTKPLDQTREFSQPRPLIPGTILKDRFVLEQIIGTGGMSVVFKARDLRKQEAQDRNPYVAMKILGEGFKSHPDSLKILQRETQKAQTLAHPNIVTVYDFDRDEDTIFMTMECLQGETLDKIIRRSRHGMPLKKALPFIEGMARALVYAHKKNIIHCDFKPGNVFCTQDGTVKILDFGIARARERKSALPQDDTMFDPGKLGALTPAYASCEMLERATEPDPRDDIYALACITYQLLAGRHPYNRLPATQARERGLRPARIKSLSRKQWAALAAGLTFARHDRPESANQFLSEFAPRSTRGRNIALSITFLLTIAGSYGVYLWRKPPQVELTAEQHAAIKDYLETAQLYLELGHLAAPPGDSAFDMYKKVLEIDQTNRAATDGISTIAEEYNKLAQITCAQQPTEECRSIIALGLRVRSDHEGLIEFQLRYGANP